MKHVIKSVLLYPAAFSLMAVFFFSCSSRYEGTYDIRQFGAKNDGTTKNTVSIQNAINAAHENGGGTVIVPHLPNRQYLVGVYLEQ